MPATLQNVHEPDQIGIDIGVRIDQRMPHAGLCGKVYHVGESVTAEQFRYRVAVGNVGLLKVEIGEAGKLLEPGFLQPRIVIGGEIVDAEYGVASFQYPPRPVHADEACRPGDKNWTFGHSYLRSSLGTG